MRPVKRTLVIGLIAFAGAGCGGDSGGGGGGGNQSAAYDAAFDICKPGVEATADLYAVEPTKEAVISIVTEQVSGGAAQDEASARKGCGDALDQAAAG